MTEKRRQFNELYLLTQLSAGSGLNDYPFS